MDFFAFLALILGTIVAKLTFPVIPLELVVFFIAVSVSYLVTRLCGDGGDWQRLLKGLVEPATPPPAGTLAPPYSFYRATLGGILDWFDERLNPEAKNTEPETSLRRAWGWRLYDKCLLLSLLYPLIFVIGQWAMSPQGTAGLIGVIPVLPSGATELKRIITVLWLILLFAYLSQKQKIIDKLDKNLHNIKIIQLELSNRKIISTTVYFLIVGIFIFSYSKIGTSALVSHFLL